MQMYNIYLDMGMDMVIFLHRLVEVGAKKIIPIQMDFMQMRTYTRTIELITRPYTHKL